LKVAANAIIIYAQIIIIELTNILFTCMILKKNFALHNLVALLNTIKHLKHRFNE
jgi:hypothetical protein